MKSEFLKLLEEDAEFRHAVMGLLGMRELLERFARLEERFNELLEEIRELRRIIMVVSHRFGVLTESAFREAMKYVVEEVLGAGAVRRVTMYDEEGLVYGHKSEVEVDLVVRDREHILVEVKSRVSRGDVAELYRVGLLYEKLYGVKPRLVLVGGFIDTDAWETAGALGVALKPALKE